MCIKIGNVYFLTNHSQFGNDSDCDCQTDKNSATFSTKKANLATLKS